MSHQQITGTILVADDQAANRELSEELLTAEGFKVTNRFKRRSCPYGRSCLALPDLKVTKTKKA